MANQLNVAMIDVIASLHKRGWSQRRIAREVGVHRETVARHLERLRGTPKPANAPIGSDDGDSGPKPANAPTGSGASQGALQSVLIPADTDEPGPGRTSQCEPWRKAIEASCEQGLSAQRIYQDLVADYGFAGSYYSVRRFVRGIQGDTELPFRRLECAPGEEGQVDFGTGAPVMTPEGRRRKTYVLRVVLSHSRKAYSEAVYRQTTDDFLRCLEGAFRHFSGVPRCLILDNLRAAVKRADWFEPELNPKVRAFAEHYGFAFWPTRPYLPRHKGKVESGIKYVKHNGLKGRRFTSLEEQNAYLRHWEATVADTRVHGTTRKQVGTFFEQHERAALIPLPVAPFANFQEGRRTVHRDGHVEVARAYYSVPPEYLNREVWVRWDARVVRIFNNRMEQIALHCRQERGRFRTQSQHIVAEKISAVERGTSWLLSRVQLLGPQCMEWALAVVEHRGIEGVRVLQGLLSLADRHPVDALERACQIALSHGAYHLKSVRMLIERAAPQQQALPLLDEHPIIRPLWHYSQFVHDVFQHKEIDQ
jgi:transposase